MGVVWDDSGGQAAAVVVAMAAVVVREGWGGVTSRGRGHHVHRFKPHQLGHAGVLRGADSLQAKRDLSAHELCLLRPLETQAGRGHLLLPTLQPAWENI